ncbi:ABC transporter substrate-binding protein [Paenibacillus allorhizosphaerae]|uniref:Extracellular solute-binding protein n=1 Tax=Paenibacillus allorhizosphaerae TaxID=2849866 RepID=A0ABN7TSP3_9BACL|nr:extracellular solute-binding protein [Paenibacillus allorhizosphaerae]CAG7654330.1 hypothetical protein PAECIP111802_05741 [Paenibacillus allorhizosphaerae]
MNKKLRYAAAIMAAIVVTSGCAKDSKQSGDSQKGAAEKNEPVTLTLYQHSAKLSDEEFKQLVADPVKAKYPHITMQLIRQGPNNNPQNLITAGQFPDMMFAAPSALKEYEKLQIVEDLNPFVKKNSFDLKKFDPHSFSTVNNICGKDRLCALPFSANPGALFFNKDIFNKFGAPYPKDGMTWDDAIEVAKKVSRQSDGVQYIGLNTGQIEWITTQLSTPRIDPKTNLANFLHDDFRLTLQKYKDIQDIPGNRRASSAINNFFKDRDTAMLTYLIGGTIGPLVEMSLKGDVFDWDMVSIPTFKEAPKKSYQSDYHLLVMSSTSKHKEEVFKVMQLLTDTASQTNVSKYARVTSLQDTKIKEVFGEAIPALKGKNIKALTVNEVADVAYHEYDSVVGPILVDAIRKIGEGSKDINTALRDAQEAANKAIQEAKK